MGRPAPWENGVANGHRVDGTVESTRRGGARGLGVLEYMTLCRGLPSRLQGAARKDGARGRGAGRGAKFAALAVVLMLTAASCAKTAEEAIDAAGLRGGETRQTLSPVNFTGPVARAYQAAREIPEILDSLYCYCDCKKHSGHKSLLTCYVDTHATHCDICIGEALMAQDLKAQGMDAVSIRKAVDREFSSLRH
jgi:hypothetical protein